MRHAADEPEHRVPKQPAGTIEREQDLAAERLEGLDEPDHSEDLDHGRRLAPARTEHDLNEIRRDDDQAHESRDRDRADETSRLGSKRRPSVRGRRHARERREEHLLERACDSRERHEDDVGRERERSERCRAEEATDQKPAEVAAGLVKECSPKTFPAKPPRRRRLAAENVAEGRTVRGTRARWSTSPTSASCWATIAQAPKSASATVIPTTAPTIVAAIARSSKTGTPCRG